MKKNTDSKKKKRYIKYILIVAAVLILIAGSISGYTYYQLSKVNTVEISKKNEDLGIKNPPVTEEKSEEIINIALFGVDVGRDKYDVPNSDSIMIATLDRKHNKLKLTSIMRDTYVEISGYGKTKINEAYAKGGAPLAIKTLNENFNLNIRDYVTVNFFGLEKVIDLLGGVTVEVKDYELKEINTWVREVAELQHKEPVLVQHTGVQNLTGGQAVAYCRLRHVGNGDFERTDRQRRVLNELFNKVRSVGVTKYPSIVSEILPQIETSISTTEILSLGTKVLTSKIDTIEQQRFPLDGYCKGEMINEIWYLVPKPDLTDTEKQIHDFIYEDIKPVPKEPLF